MKEQKRKVNITIDEDIHLKLETLKLELRKSGEIGTHITMSNMIGHLFDNYENPPCSEVIEVEPRTTERFRIGLEDVNSSAMLRNVGVAIGLDKNENFYLNATQFLFDFWNEHKNMAFWESTKKHALPK